LRYAFEKLKILDKNNEFKKGITDPLIDS